MIKKRLHYYVIIFLLVLSVLPSSHMNKAAAKGDSIIINTQTLNVRKGPGLSFPVTAQVHKGDEFKSVGSEGDWFKIQLNSSDTGWVANWLVSKKTQPSVKKGVVTDNGLRLREGPGTSQPVIDTLAKGQEVQINNSDGGWYEVSVGSTRGWVHKDYISTGSSPEKKSEPAVTGEQGTGVATVNSLNVRSSGSLNGSIIGKLNKGSRVTITGSAPGWYRIQFGNNEGWTSSQYIEKSGAAVQSSKASYGKVTVHSLNLRDKAGLSGSVTGSVKKGEVYQILEEKNNWYKLSLKGGKTGWAAGWYIEKTIGEEYTSAEPVSGEGEVQILYNGTNLRGSASTDGSIVARAFSGDTFPIKRKTGDWYEISLKNGQSAYVAGWIVSVKGESSSSPVSNRKSAGLKGKTVVIDPGHGGHDSGTTGYRGTLEKELTLSTSQLLYELLRNAGANVVLTRSDDTYSPLNSRVAIAHYYDSDAFISIHYDSINDSSIKGYTAYYYHDYQKKLSKSVLNRLSETLSSRNRGVKQGDYHVIRENKQPAVLLELGYLSNPSEEALVNTNSFQDMAARSIYNGLTDYFSN
ncbi:SH3 domain-containing protein [Bacillus sp. AK031]